MTLLAFIEGQNDWKIMDIIYLVRTDIKYINQGMSFLLYLMSIANLVFFNQL